jgi:putative Mg2+ transporter-C (MgtC) family protein
MDVELHVAVRLLAAAGLGAVIGAEREMADHPAGIRTHLTVALGAALFGVLSTLGFEEFQRVRSATNVQVDVTRVASTVVTGVGFLGAGVIFRRGNTVHNLTTAGSLWVVAAIGLACGVGNLGPALVASGVLVGGLVALRWPRQWVRSRLAHDRDSVRVLLRPGATWEDLERSLRDLPGVDVTQLNLEKDDGAYVVAAQLRARPGVELRDRLSGIAARDDVRTLTLGGPVAAD